MRYLAANLGHQFTAMGARAVIAAGSRPVRLGGLEIDSPRVVDSPGVLKLETVPEAGSVAA